MKFISLDCVSIKYLQYGLFVLQMDIVLEYADEYLLDRVYVPLDMSRNNLWRQLLSLLLIVNVGGFFVYMIPASLSYHFLFDKRHLKHPQILKVRLHFQCVVATLRLLSQYLAVSLILGLFSIYTS